MRRQVMIRQGCVDGFSDADPVITVFRGIPYAKPPVDELRWREPQPAEAWDGVLEAGDFAPMPMQPLPGSDEFYGREWQIDADTPMAEDCLYLNIWTPALRGCGSGSEIRTDSRCDGHGLPVMVWSGSDWIYLREGVQWRAAGPSGRGGGLHCLSVECVWFFRACHVGKGSG